MFRKLFAALAAAMLLCSAAAAQQTQVPAQDFYRGLEIPVTVQDADHEVHTYSGYTLCYRESYEVAEWVAYLLTKEELVKVVGRTNDFRPDTSISTGSADLSDYKRSGYDRGHLAPAADMRWSEQAMHDCFLLSNITPQDNKFNSGIWNDLENFVRTVASRFGAVWVVTGPVLEKPASGYPSIGGNKVCVPEYFYKVLLVRRPAKNGEPETVQAIGFIIKNEKSHASIWDFAVPVDQVEERTGLDFFSLLPDDVENAVEVKWRRHGWK